MDERAGPAGRGRRIVAESLVGAAGAAALAFAVLAGPGWLDRHFLPEFFNPRREQLAALNLVRIAAGGLGLALLLLVRPWLGRIAARNPRLLTDLAPTLAAVALALAAGELLLRQFPWLWTQEAPPSREPLRRRDPLLGWTYLPSRVGQGEVGGRRVEYAFDAGGRRVASTARPVDYAAPSIIFAGESIMAGHGLTWEESIPARTAARLGLQPVNLAVEGYATDQAFMRLQSEWPRFERPVAVVFLFMPLLFHRNLDTDRPHLAEGLAWRPPRDDLRLAQIARRLVPYRSAREIAAAEAVTRQVLAATVAMARARGAEPLILTPQLTPETPAEAAIRRRILDRAGLPYLQVAVDPAWRLPRNRHPDASAAEAIAEAIARRLDEVRAEHRIEVGASQEH